MHKPEVIFSFKLYKSFLAVGLLVVAIGIDSSYQNAQTLDLLLLALIFHLVALLNFIGGTIIITKNHVIFVMSFMVKIKKKRDIVNFELDPYAWWAKRLRLVAVKKNGKRLVVTDVNKAADDDNDTRPERIVFRLNCLFASDCE